MAIRMTRRRRSEWDSTAPLVDTYTHRGRILKVGDEVTVSSKEGSVRSSFIGTIERLVIPKGVTEWHFAVVVDGTGGSHACDLDELS